MEIERKWMVTGWPKEDWPVLYTHKMRQGYVNVRPTVRIREEIRTGQDPEYILCCKSEGGLARKEIEMPVPADKFAELEDLIGLPLISKERRTYHLPDGRHLEVNHVDQGQPSEFWYAEIEYESVEAATSWKPEGAAAEYLNNEVTGQPGSTMGAYWEMTRKRKYGF